jgi:hypothetical protein
MVTQLVKKYPFFYGTRRFNIVFTRDRALSLLYARRIQSTTSPPYFPKIHSNIILPPMPTSFEWSLPLTADQVGQSDVWSWFRAPDIYIFESFGPGWRVCLLFMFSQTLVSLSAPTHPACIPFGVRYGLVVLFPFGFLIKNLYPYLISPMRPTCPAHLIHPNYVTRIISGKADKLRSSSLSISSLLLLPNSYQT